LEFICVFNKDKSAHSLATIFSCDILLFKAMAEQINPLLIGYNIFF